MLRDTQRGRRISCCAVAKGSSPRVRPVWSALARTATIYVINYWLNIHYVYIYSAFFKPCKLRVVTFNTIIFTTKHTHRIKLLNTKMRQTFRADQWWPRLRICEILDRNVHFTTGFYFQIPAAASEILYWVCVLPINHNR